MADRAAMVEARDAEIARLRDLLRSEHERANAAIDREGTAEDYAEELEAERDRYKSAWASARRRAKRAYGAWRYATWRLDQVDEEQRKDDDYARFLWGRLTERRKERDRYRLAWLSARRRAAEEAMHGADAVEHYEGQLQALRAELDVVRKSPCAPAGGEKI
ncbi:hypothetical protein [Streptomyces sparsogenes]|uniref:hypothetical protein n=1 Tax=Streptomyces sparsogenes TaxID=67365 RepID=UPI0033F08CCD